MHRDIEDQHDRPTYGESSDDIRELIEFMNVGFERITHRIDHIIGRHDFDREAACPVCAD